MEKKSKKPANTSREERENNTSVQAATQPQGKVEAAWPSESDHASGLCQLLPDSRQGQQGEKATTPRRIRDSALHSREVLRAEAVALFMPLQIKVTHQKERADSSLQLLRTMFPAVYSKDRVLTVGGGLLCNPASVIK